MKPVKTGNRIFFLLLMAGLIFNIFWSRRLETTAQELSSRVDEHHNSLSQNEDSLTKLKLFSRTTVGGQMIELRDKDVLIGAGDGEVTIRVGEKKRDFEIALLPKHDLIRIEKGNSHIWLGNSGTGHVKNGIYITSSAGPGKGSGFWVEERGIQMKIIDGGDFSISVQKGEAKLQLDIDPENELIEVKKDRSVIRIGKGSIGEGVELGQFDTGTVALTKGEGVGLSAREGNPMTITGKDKLDIDFDGDININAKGNINIRSSNGDVKINGKNVRFNE